MNGRSVVKWIAMERRGGQPLVYVDMRLGNRIEQLQAGFEESQSTKMVLTR